MLIDTHAHLDFEDFDNDRDEVVKRAFDNGIEKIINVGCSLERSVSSIDISSQYDNVFASVGIHPDEAASLKDEASLRKKIKEIAGSSDKVVALGECGLDYSHIKAEPEKKQQEALFRLHLELAEELQLPVIVHVRDVFDEAYQVIKNYPNVSGVMHCFAGSATQAQKFIALGFLVSFTGIVTFKNATEIHEAAREIPLGKMMVETDCPFIAPEPNRGKRNEPAYVRFVGEKICELKEVNMAEVEKITTNNAQELFDI